MAINAAAITSEIAALSVRNVTIKDVTEIPESVVNRDCPLFFPSPGNWLNGGNAANEESTTFGTPDSRLWHVSSGLNYIYLHSAVGAGRGNSDNYYDAVLDIEALITALVALDVSGVDVVTVSHTPIKVMSSPTQTKFTGCEFTIAVRERINA